MRTKVVSDSGDVVRIMELEAEGINGIKNKISIHFGDGINVLCGVEGIGKSTILRIIEDAIFGNVCLRKNAFCPAGEYMVLCSTNQRTEIIHNRITEKEPVRRYGQMVIPYMDGLSTWFLKRYLLGDSDEDMTENQKQNTKLAVAAFSLLDPDVSIGPGTVGVRFRTTMGEMDFEQLSSGYRSCIRHIHNMIKEVERLCRTGDICIKEFDGCILIEDMEQGLDPFLQVRFLYTLRELFPETQFIITSNSTYIQHCLYHDEVIFMARDREGGLRI